MVLEDCHYFIRGILAKNRRILSKAITLVESRLAAHETLAQKIIDGILPHTGNAVRLGITGVPGVGKSTFIENFGIRLVEKRHTLAVLAVDPSSRRSGGSVMADKTRMEKLSTHPAAFIRPSPSGGTLGGVARKTRETMLLCEAAGFDVILVETVGVGQSEIAVASMVDFFLVLMLAGAGDEIQGIKKGVLEIADALAINKADQDNLDRARHAQKDYESALNLLAPASPSWKPPVLTCSSLEQTGLDEIWEVVLDHRGKLMSTGELEVKRKHQSIDWMWSLVEEGMKDRLQKNPKIKICLPSLIQSVEQGTLSPAAAAFEVLGCLEESDS